MDSQHLGVRATTTVARLQRGKVPIGADAERMVTTLTEHNAWPVQRVITVIGLPRTLNSSARCWQPSIVVFSIGSLASSLKVDDQPAPVRSPLASHLCLPAARCPKADTRWPARGTSSASCRPAHQMRSLPVRPRQTVWRPS